MEQELIPQEQAKELVKQEILEGAFSVDYYNPDMLENIRMQEYTKIPITEISALGAAFSAAIPVIARSATDLYTTTTKGLAHAKGSMGGVRGFVRGSNGIQEHATFHKVGTAGANVPMLFMAVAMMGIQHEIKELQKMHTELLEIIERDKKSQLITDMEILNEYATGYKYYWDNPATITVNLNQVKNIKRNARKDYISYSEEIQEILNGKMNTLLNYGAPKKVNKLSDRFSRYRLSLYVYSFATYMEVLLSGNLNTDYLKKTGESLKQQFDQYREIYTNCYNEIDHTITTALGANLASAYASANKFVGEQIRKIKWLDKKDVDDLIIANGEVIEAKEAERLQKVRENFITYKDSGIYSFVTDIKTIDHLYNEEVELFWDDENVYIDLPKTA